MAPQVGEENDTLHLRSPNMASLCSPAFSKASALLPSTFKSLTRSSLFATWRSNTPIFVFVSTSSKNNTTSNSKSSSTPSAKQLMMHPKVSYRIPIPIIFRITNCDFKRHNKSAEPADFSTNSAVARSSCPTLSQSR